MYQITFHTEESQGGEPQTIRAKNYLVLPGGVLELEGLDGMGPGNVQLLAPQVWQNALIKFVGADGEEG